MSKSMHQAKEDLDAKNMQQLSVVNQKMSSISQTVRESQKILSKSRRDLQYVENQLASPHTSPLLIPAHLKQQALEVQQRVVQELIAEREKHQFVALASRYDPSLLKPAFSGAADQLIQQAQKSGFIDNGSQNVLNSQLKQSSDFQLTIKDVLPVQFLTEKVENSVFRSTRGVANVQGAVPEYLVEKLEDGYDLKLQIKSLTEKSTLQQNEIIQLQKTLLKEETELGDALVLKELLERNCQRAREAALKIIEEEQENAE